MKEPKSYMRYICWILVLLAVASISNAQRFVNATLDGAQTVCAITQDNNGVMWLGTENGLYRYDGYHGYRHYDEHSFSNTRVNALAIRGYRLLLATGNGMLQFNMLTHRYESTKASEEYDDNTKRKETRTLRVVSPKGVQVDYGSDVYAMLNTPKGLLVGRLTGLYLGKRKLPITNGTQPLVNALAYDSQRHCYWIGTEGDLYRADLSLSRFTKVPGLSGNSIKCLSLDEDGNLYIGTDNGLYEMTRYDAVTHYIHDSNNASSIPNNIVWACYVDKWQNVWIGTDNGLSRLATTSSYQYVTLDKVTASSEGNCLHEIMQTRSGEWWMGGTNGVIRFKALGGFSRNPIYSDVAWYKQNSRQHFLSHNRVRKIYEDNDGDVWICTDHGINLYDRTTGQLRNFIVYDRSHRYSTAWAYDILQDRQGRMWMASYMGGVFVIDKHQLLEGKTIADIHLADKGGNALFGLHVGQLVMDGNGMVWASTNNRLDRIDPRTMKVAHMEHADVVNYLMADAKGNVWTGGNKEVRCFVVDGQSKDKQPTVRVWDVGGKVSTMCEVGENIWVASGNECSVLSPDEKSIRFAIPLITPFVMYYSPSSYQVVMGGNDGFVSIDEAVAMPMNSHAPLLLSGVVVNGELRHEWRKDKLTLESDENNFTLQFTDLPFTNNLSDVYACKLEGSDHDWQYKRQGDIDITYNGLPYGKYHFAVHIVTGEGKIGDEVYSLDISILPPWYLTVWAKLLYLIIIVVLAVSLMRFYFIRKRLAEERRQKAEILEQAEARMNFYNRLTEGLKTAVAHRSFEEITELTARLLDMPAAEDTSVAPEPQSPVMDEADARLLEEINKAIETHMIDSEFNVTRLQEVVGLGNKQLYRKMKTLTGHTPVEYIRDMRLRKAAKLLKAGKFNVSEVMNTVGFSNSSYFSKCFSKAFGMTPTEYMKETQ